MSNRLSTLQVKELLKQNKTIYVNSFEWVIKLINNVYQIYCPNTDTIFCPAFNEKNELILKGANYITFN